MESIDLEPGYSTSAIPGKCIKCLAEQKLDSCLRMLLLGGADDDDRDLQQQYEMLVTFLTSSESRELRDESERLLSEGKDVRLRLSLNDQGPEYSLEVK